MGTDKVQSLIVLLKQTHTYTRTQAHTHMQKHTDMLTVPAAMGMENAEVQGHFEYSAAWGSPLSVHHNLLLTHALKNAHTTHCRWAYIPHTASH